MTIKSWVLGSLMLVTGIVIGFLGRPLVLSDRSAGSNTVADQLIAQVRHWKGNANAPITMLEVGDFQCSFCARFATGAGRQIDEVYIKTGLVRFGYSHMAFLGPESQWAAEASECANEQGKFWEYHDLLYAQYDGKNRVTFNKENLKKIAVELRLDATKFNACLDVGKYAGLVQEQTRTLQGLGIQGTPTFLINRRLVSGALPFEQFKQIIEATRSK